MKLGHIAPGELLFQLQPHIGDYHLILNDQLRKDPLYKQFYQEARASGDFLMLDNDAFEKGVGADYGELAEVAREVGVQEVILTDELRSDAYRSIELAQNCALGLIREGLDQSAGVTFAAVLQAKNYRDYVDLAVCMRMEVPNVRTLCLPWKSRPEDAPSRELQLMDVAEMLDSVGIDDTEIHLIGVSHELEEFTDVCATLARGLDTAKFIHWGLAGYTPAWPHDAPRGARRPEKYLERRHPLDTVEYQNAVQNIRRWNYLAEEGVSE